MAFRRVVNLRAGREAEGIDLSELHIDFIVERSIDFSANSAQLKIFNPSFETIDSFLTKGNSIVLEAGYEDEGTGAIYVGQIVSSVSYKDGANRIVDVTAGSIQNANRELEYVTVSLSYARGVTVTTPLRDVANALGLATYGFELANTVRLQNGFTFAGTAKGMLNRLKNILINQDIDLFIDNTTIVLFKRNTQDSRFSAVNLTPATGLIGSAQLTDNIVVGDKDEDFTQRVLFKSILNPALQPNGTIVIDSERVSGVFIVEKLTFTGNNYGGDFTTDGEAVA